MPYKRKTRRRKTRTRRRQISFRSWLSKAVKFIRRHRLLSKGYAGPVPRSIGLIGGSWGLFSAFHNSKANKRRRRAIQKMTDDIIKKNRKK